MEAAVAPHPKESVFPCFPYCVDACRRRGQPMGGASQAGEACLIGRDGCFGSGVAPARSKLDACR